MVVGGGPSGLLVAERLTGQGLSCLVLEAGPVPRRPLPDTPAQFAEATKPLVKVDDQAWQFRASGLAYDWIRVRAAGGRSLLWGGWCERMGAQNLRDAKALDAPWPLTLTALEPYYRAAERHLNVRSAPLDPFFTSVTAKLGLEVVPKRAALAPSGRRPFIGLDLPRRTRLQPNTVALRVDNRRGAVRGVEVVEARTGATSFVAARALVLCASPIETTRLLLASEIRSDSGTVGRGLVDHLVASCLAVLPRPAPTSGPLGPLQRTALVPRFVNVGRSRRRDYRSGFSVEMVGPIALDQLGREALKAIGVGAREAKRLSYCLVHAMGEAHPHRQRFVSLDTKRRDTLGRAIPVVHLAWSDEQKLMARDMAETVAAIANALAPAGSRIIPFRDPLRPGGIAHEAGTAPVGRGPRHGVTDPRGAVYGLKGLYVADASIMPTALDRHPTLTMLALALRVADRVVEDGKRGG